MKHLLFKAVLFLSLLNILFPLNAIAVEEDAIKYGANESFVILIPSGFTFDISNKYITEVIARNVLISSGKTLDISISSNNYDNKWVAKDLASGGKFIKNLARTPPPQTRSGRWGMNCVMLITT